MDGNKTSWLGVAVDAGCTPQLPRQVLASLSEKSSASPAVATVPVMNLDLSAVIAQIDPLLKQTEAGQRVSEYGAGEYFGGTDAEKSALLCSHGCWPPPSA